MEQTKTMSHLTRDSVISKNNSGAMQIQTGNYSEAILRLSDSITSSKYYLEKQHVHCQEVCSVDLDLLMTRNWKVLSENLGSLCNQPIFFPVEKTPSPELHSAVVLSAVSIYNLALAHHLLAVSVPFKGPMLKKAIRLYQLALQIPEGNISDFASDTLFYLTMINNIADAHRRLGNHSESDAIFQELFAQLMYVKTARKGLSEYLEVFFQNTFYLVSGQDGIAAAAA